MNYLQISTKRVVTPLVLRNSFGLDPYNPEEAFKKGFARIEYMVYPQPDPMYYTVKAKPELTKMSEERYVQEFDIVGLPVSDVSKVVKAKVTDKRWEVETGGLILPNGVKVLTAIEDQNRVATSIQGMEAAGLDEIDFKSSSGWVKLTLAELKQISVAITMHVEGCFARECELHKACDAATTVEELKDIAENAINVGWPNYENAEVLAS